MNSGRKVYLIIDIDESRKVSNELIVNLCKSKVSLYHIEEFSLLDMRIINLYSEQESITFEVPSHYSGKVCFVLNNHSRSLKLLFENSH